MTATVEPPPDAVDSASSDGAALPGTSFTGASARTRRRKQRYVVAAAVCAVAILAVVFLAVMLSDNVVYFRTVSEAVSDRSGQGSSRFRLAGAVVPGTIHETHDGVRFDVTDGKKTVRVDHRGDPPELFKNGAPVVCEGRWAKQRALIFDSDRIMIKHGSDYSPPKVDAKQAPGRTTKPDVQAVTG